MSGPETPQAIRSIRARTDASIREAEASARPKGDLAASIVALARTAEKRRGTRVDLIEATDTIARAVRKELRSGDKVTIQFPNLTTNLPVPPVTYYAGRAREKSNIYKEHDALLRGDAILGVTGSGFDWEWVLHRGLAFDGYIATDDERRAFAAEAAAVVVAFRSLLESEARDNDDLARSVAKLTPR